MEQKDILSILQKKEVSHYLDEISQVHMYTKHYLLVAEEISEDGVTFLQPLKEHRDAYDHMARIFSLSLRNDLKEDEIEKYITDNIKKAFGHEYRAFFDMADWFTYICRKYIREELSYNSKRRKYEEKYDFEETRKFINELPFKIAEYREKKDVSNERPILQEVLEYKKTMDNLLEIYQKVQLL